MAWKMFIHKLMLMHVAKYIDEMGCSLSEACEELGIDPSKVFVSYSNEDEFN